MLFRSTLQRHIKFMLSQRCSTRSDPIAKGLTILTIYRCRSENRSMSSWDFIQNLPRLAIGRIKFQGSLDCCRGAGNVRKLELRNRKIDKD